MASNYDNVSHPDGMEVAASQHEKHSNGNYDYPGLVEHNAAAAVAIDKHNNSWNGKKYTYNKKGCGIKGCPYDD